MIDRVFKRYEGPKGRLLSKVQGLREKPVYRQVEWSISQGDLYTFGFCSCDGKSTEEHHSAVRWNGEPQRGTTACEMQSKINLHAIGPEVAGCVRRSSLLAIKACEPTVKEAVAMGEVYKG